MAGIAQILFNLTPENKNRTTLYEPYLQTIEKNEGEVY